MENKREQIQIEAVHVEWLIKQVERSKHELDILRAESKVLHGVLNLVDRVTDRPYGYTNNPDPFMDAKKAFQEGVSELQGKSSRS